jgi:hypothetical protein
MKMISTPTVAATTDYPAYVHNCLRNAKCEPSWTAPLPGVPYLQLYVEYGANPPAAVEFTLRDVCAGTDEQIFPSNYVVGKTPEGVWYGVFKYFNTPMTAITSFVVRHYALLDAPAGLVPATWFSEMIVVEPCLPLTKVKACYPEGATDTGFDSNGVYYGLPTNLDFLGQDGIRFFHIAYVRLGKVREVSNKATFKSSLVTTFRSTLERIYQLDTELVPRWYKDELLAIYLRGAIQVDDGPVYVVSDLAFEAINEDDLTWKPFAQLKTTTRLYFGCDSSECVECCSPIILDAFTQTEAESGSGSGGSGSGGEPTFLVEVQNAYNDGGNEITSVSPLFFTVEEGSFPLPGGTGSVRGNHSGFTGVISVTVALGGAPAGTLRLFVTGEATQCVDVPSDGTYAFASTTIDPGDDVFIMFFDDNCGP